MEDILSTKLLEYEKSTFIIDLIKHSSGRHYITVEQIVHLNNRVNESQRIKIHFSILEDIIEALAGLQKQVPVHILSKKHFPRERKEELIRRYLIGVSIKDLALQFNCSANTIEQVLVNNGIAIVSNELPKEGRSRRKRRSNRKR